MVRASKALTKGFEDGFRDLNKYLRRHYLTKSYRFHSIVPVDRNKYFSIPRQEWKQQKQQWSMLRFYLYMGLFVVGFALTDALYSLYNNPKQSYRLYLYYPKLTHKIDTILQHESTKQWLQLLSKIWVKDQIEFRSFWQNFNMLLNEKKRLQKKQEHDQRVRILKQELNYVDKKYKLKSVQERSDVF